MITWSGPTQPSLDPHRRELHSVPMFYTVEQASRDTVRFVLLVAALAFVAVLGCLLGAHE